MSKKKILIIDDEPAIIYSIQKSLKGLSYELHSASNGHDGLEILKELTPNLIILDLSMPLMNGIDFLKAIRLKPDDPYAIIVLTGFGDDDKMRQCYDLGIHFFCRKPFGATDFKCLVERCITFKELEYEALQYRRHLEDSVESQNSYINKLSVAIDQSATSIIMSDHHGKITYINHSYSEVSGFTLNDIKGKDILSLIAPENGIERDDVKNHIANGSSWKGELQSLRRNGESYWVSAAINAIKNIHGEITNYILIQDDITLQKEAENIKNQSIELVKQHRREKQNFSDNINHEILTPIHIIRTAISILESQNIEPSQKKYIEFIHNSVNDLQSLTTMILTMKRIGSECISPHVVPFSLAPLLEEIIQAQLPKVTAKGIELRSQIDSALTDPIQTDPMLLLQIVSYLVDNAIKFTHSGHITITANTDAASGHLNIAITDTGIGIPESKIQTIFESYQQADATNSRSYNGIGLGLTLAQSLTYILGGEISVTSQEQQGSTFSVKLPLASS